MRSLLRRMAWWILGTVRPAADELDDALKGAFADAGLPMEHYCPEFNLRHTGKFADVLIHAGERLGNPLVTVADLRRVLR